MYQFVPTHLISIFNSDLKNFLAHNDNAELYVGNGTLLVVTYDTHHSGDYFTTVTICEYHYDADLLGGGLHLSSVHYHTTQGTQSDWDPSAPLENLSEEYSDNLRPYDVIYNTNLWERAYE